MSSRYTLLTLATLFTLSTLAGCSNSASVEYKVLSQHHDSTACHISSSICVETHNLRPIDYEKDEMLITYDSEQADEIADDILKKYRLRAKSRDNLDTINTKMITAATNGQDPYDLSRLIRKREKQVDANTSNFYTTSAVATPVANAYPLNLTGVGIARQRTNGNGIRIGMIDTPVDINQNDSLGSLVERIDLIPPGNELNRLHGTEVAGIMVSKNPRIGVAPEAKLIAISAFSTSPENPKQHRSNSGLVAKALQIAIDENVDVLNLSFAGGSDPIVDRLVQAAINRGIVVVASAGNGGPNAQPAYPAAIDGVIAVTAVDKQRNVFTRANRGSYIDLAAPGVGILTTAPGSSYHISSGTSLATAHVSGIIALLKSIDRGFNPHTLQSTAIDLGQRGPDQNYGYGLVSIGNALNRLRVR